MKVKVPGTVYVLDAWNDTTQTSVAVVFRTAAAARRERARVTSQPGVWYAQVVKRVVRRAL